MTEQKTISRKRGRPRKVRLSREGEPELLRRANLHERAANQMRGMIVEGKLSPGAAIVEAELCEVLGISRTPLREAVKLLAAQGLVELRPNRSARVAPMDAAHITDLFEALGNLERISAEYAAQRLTLAELSDLRAMQERMERHYESGDLVAYFAVNQAIHSFILSGARNAMLIEMHRWLFARAERARYFALGSHSRWVESIQEHRGILAALEARDSQAAGQLLAVHVQHTGVGVLAMLARSQQPASREHLSSVTA